jgi:hypothetical protein
MEQSTRPSSQPRASRKPTWPQARRHIGAPVRLVTRAVPLTQSRAAFSSRAPCHSVISSGGHPIDCHPRIAKQVRNGLVEVEACRQCKKGKPGHHGADFVTGRGTVPQRAAESALRGQRT